MKALNDKRQLFRISLNERFEFNVLFTESDKLHKIKVTGKIVNFTDAGIGISTDFPLEPGQVLEWNDKHKKGGLHMAAIRWSTEMEGCYTAGAVLI